MGRLFWKFFAFIWLAQLAGIIAIGSTFWLTERHSERVLYQLDSGPGAWSAVRAAAALLNAGGTAAFAGWAEHEHHPAVFAVDDTGQDLLGRPVASEVLESARRLHASDPHSALVTTALDHNAHAYLIFTVSDAPDRLASPPSGPPQSRALRGFPPLMPMLGTLFASVLTAVLLAWYVAKPIRSLRSAFESLSSGNLGGRVGHQIGAWHDELADLGRDFDRMAERLQGAMEGQRRLLHDVSHEVRSPLARLQAAVGLMRQRHDGEDIMVDRIEEEIARIDRLIGDLLKLSRIEAGELAEEIATVDLRELLLEIVADANFEAQTTGQIVVWSNQALDAPLLLPGRPELLRGAIENLVRNALKHAPDARQVTIETAVDGARGAFRVRVIDSGPGVPEAELDTLFRPFYRSASGARTDGYGLGLAIARRSVEAHGGTLRAENRAEGGLCVELMLPT